MRKLFQQAILSAVSFALIFVASNANAEETWVIDSAHTSIAFKVSAVGYSLIRGTFTKFDGQMMVNFETPSRSRVEFNVASNSVKTGSASLDSFIISPVMFDAEKFPEMRCRTHRRAHCQGRWKSDLSWQDKACDISG